MDCKPKLRFPEFSGEWEKKKLGDIIQNQSSKYNPENDENNYKCVELEHLSQNTGHLLGYCDSKEQNSIKNKFESGNVLFGKLRPYLKKYWYTTFDGVCSTEIWVFNGKTVTNEFLYQMIQTHKFNYIANISSGSKMPRSDWKYMCNVNFNVPSIFEQQKIASFLSKLDEKIEKLTKKQELWETYKKGMMQQLFSQKLRFKDENGEDYPDWEKKPLNGVSILNPKSINLPKKFIYIDLESVESGILKKRTLITKDEAPSRAQRVLKDNDILYQTVRPYQRNNFFFNSINSGFYVASTGYAQIRSKEDPEFIYHVLHTDDFVNNVLARCTGTSYPAINSKDLGKIKINIPSLLEQKKISKFISAIDIKTERLEKELEINSEYKKGLLQQMFC